MNKITIIILVALTILVVVFLSYYFISRQKIGNIVPSQITITQAPINNGKQELAVVTTNPQNNAVSIPLNTPINISFNRRVNPDEIIFSIAPKVPFTQNVVDNDLKIKFNQQLATGTSYTFVIKYKNPRLLPDPFLFTTTGPTPLAIPNTYPEEYADAEELVKKTQPDVYLSNKTPFSTNDFSISSSFKAQPTGHFGFTIILKSSDLNVAKNQALEWIRSIGLTDSQINSLDITYQP